ncbi:MAG: hypothetical protein PF436_00155 [Prolixibacteraceae bacterium]|jgi:hypothetical protein|nr:hypothetical protein [Prolixibacteraceae bacterium]
MLKSIYFIFIFVIIVDVSYGQLKLSGGGGGSNTNSANTEKEDEKEQINVKSEIKTWKLSKQFSIADSVALDSLTLNFHTYNPIFKHSISNTYLGYLGSPYVSNVFFKRDNRNDDFYFLRNLSAYRRTIDEVVYYNTTTPYAVLKYSQGSQLGGGTEQTFKAFFTQNIDSLTNFGFDYDVIKTPSQYLNQGVLNKYLNVFVSRNSPRYNGYLSLINGSNNLTENGGIPFNSFRRNLRPSDLPVNLASAIQSDNKSFNLFTSHEYLMGQLPFFERDTMNVDSVEVEKFRPVYSVQYSAEFSNFKRYVNEVSANTAFFDTTLIGSSNHTDSVFYKRFHHIFQLNAFENEERKFTFGKRAFIENEIVQAKHPIGKGQRQYNYSNLYVGGEIYRSLSDFWTWDVNARFTILGRNLGDAKIEGRLEKPFRFKNDTVLVKLNGWYSDFSPNIFQEHWYSNHFKWENDFRKQHEVYLKSKIDYPKYNLSAGTDYALFSNYLYNNANAMPDQFAGEFSVFSVHVEKLFNFWRFGWHNKAVWQVSSNNSVLKLPALALYSSLYYSHYLFKVMQIQLGAEVYFHSKFEANAYEPSTSQFYIQNEMETGGYPMANLFFNAKLKRTSAFVQLMHASSFQYLNFGDFYSAVPYPLEQMAVRFGFYWTFYD